MRTRRLLYLALLVASIALVGLGIVRSRADRRVATAPTRAQDLAPPMPGRSGAPADVTNNIPVAGAASPADRVPQPAADAGAGSAPEAAGTDGFISQEEVVLWGPEAPLEMYARRGDEIMTFQREHRIGTVDLGTQVRVGATHGTYASGQGQWTRVSIGSVAGWVESHAVVTLAETKEATVLRPAVLHRSRRDYSPDDAVTVEPGTILLALGRCTAGCYVRLPDESAGWLPTCLLSFDPGELAVAHALQGRQGEREAAKATYATARLAPVLDGKPAADSTCAISPSSPRKVKRAIRVGPPPVRVPAPQGLEVLGIWHSGYPGIHSPSVHDWITLGREHGGIPAEGTLPPEQRERLRQAEIARSRDEISERPRIDFDVPASELQGVYHGLRASGIVQPLSARLVGTLFPQVDCDGCELGDRTYAGRAVLSMPSDDAALVVWFPRAARFTNGRSLKETTWASVKDGKSFEIRIPDASGELRSFTLPASEYSITGEPVSIKGAYVTALAESRVRLLIVETNGNPACERGLWLYEVKETSLQLLGGNDFACDV